MCFFGRESHLELQNSAAGSTTSGRFVGSNGTSYCTQVALALKKITKINGVAHLTKTSRFTSISNYFHSYHILNLFLTFCSFITFKSLFGSYEWGDLF